MNGTSTTRQYDLFEMQLKAINHNKRHVISLGAATHSLVSLSPLAVSVINVLLTVDI